MLHNLEKRRCNYALVVVWNLHSCVCTRDQFTYHTLVLEQVVTDTITESARLGLRCGVMLRRLTGLCLLQRRSACQGPRGRLCVACVPGCDPARRTPGHVRMGSSCSQPAVQELQDPGPHHRHRIQSVTGKPVGRRGSRFTLLIPSCRLFPVQDPDEEALQKSR